VWSRVPGGRAGISDRQRSFVLALERGQFRGPILQELLRVEQEIHERPD
jgi:hypothetical protein